MSRAKFGADPLKTVAARKLMSIETDIQTCTRTDRFALDKLSHGPNCNRTEMQHWMRAVHLRKKETRATSSCWIWADERWKSSAFSAVRSKHNRTGGLSASAINDFSQQTHKTFRRALFSRGPIYKTSDEERKAFLIGTTYRRVKNIGISAHFTYLLKFRNFVFFASEVTIFSDHNALVYLRECAPKSAKLTRWALGLQEFMHADSNIFHTYVLAKS